MQRIVYIIIYTLATIASILAIMYARAMYIVQGLDYDYEIDKINIQDIKTGIVPIGMTLILSNSSNFKINIKDVKFDIFSKDKLIIRSKTVSEIKIIPYGKNIIRISADLIINNDNYNDIINIAKAYLFKTKIPLNYKISFKVFGLRLSHKDKYIYIA